MKKNAVVVLALAVLMLFAVFAPAAMAKTPKKIAVAVTRGGTVWTLGLDFWTTEGGVFHSRNSEITGSIYTIVGEGINLGGTNRGIVDQNLNIEGMTEVLKYGKGNMRIDSTVTLTDGVRSGTFEGILQYQGSFIKYEKGKFAGFLIPGNAVAHGVWHGTGDFQGWTYTLEEEFVGGTSQGVEAYILIP